MANIIENTLTRSCDFSDCTSSEVTENDECNGEGSVLDDSGLVVGVCGIQPYQFELYETESNASDESESDIHEGDRLHNTDCPQRALFPVVCLSAMITQHHGRIPEAPAEGAVPRGLLISNDNTAPRENTRSGKQQMRAHLQENTAEGSSSNLSSSTSVQQGPLGRLLPPGGDLEMVPGLHGEGPFHPQLPPLARRRGGMTGGQLRGLPRCYRG
ncbi:UNVERIFIED_CONTAM: hypothetical protein FKN15_072986 [Acipenser sinensis]